MPSSGKVQLYIAVSIDGYISPPDGSVRWLDEFFDVDYGFHTFMKDVSSIVMGRTTYDQVRSFDTSWPYGSTKCVVLTTHPPDDAPATAEVEFSNRPVTEIVEELRAAGNVWLLGGGVTTRSFLEASAIDEYLIFVMPVLLGSGIPLFPADFASRRLDLKESTPFSNGAVLTHYVKR